MNKFPVCGRVMYGGQRRGVARSCLARFGVIMARSGVVFRCVVRRSEGLQGRALQGRVRYFEPLRGAAHWRIAWCSSVWHSFVRQGQAVLGYGIVWCDELLRVVAMYDPARLGKAFLGKPIQGREGQSAAARGKAFLGFMGRGVEKQSAVLPGNVGHGVFWQGGEVQSEVRHGTLLHGHRVSLRGLERPSGHWRGCVGQASALRGEVEWGEACFGTVRISEVQPVSRRGDVLRAHVKQGSVGCHEVWSGAALRGTPYKCKAKCGKLPLRQCDALSCGVINSRARQGEARRGKLPLRLCNAWRSEAFSSKVRQGSVRRYELWYGFALLGEFRSSNVWHGFVRRFLAGSSDVWHCPVEQCVALQSLALSCSEAS